MKKIVCELCEGTQFQKEDGFFVCQGCGTRYSLAEAKALMQEVEGDAPAAPAAPAAGVPVGNPNQAQIDNMLILATNAKEAGNNQEAENYCNQIIALDATCYRAWFLKGQAAGWQSSIKNQRITEAAHAFAQAYDYAPEDEKENIKDRAVEELKNIGLAFISLRKDRFSKYPDDEELAGFDTDRANLLNALMVLLSKGIAAGIPDGYLEEIATMMNQAAVAGYKTASDKYKNEKHPVESDWIRCRDALCNCITLTEKAINASDDDDEADITRYKNLIVYSEYLCELKCYTGFGEYTQVGMNKNGIQGYRNRVEGYKKKIAAIENAVKARKKAEAAKAELEKQGRIAEYWGAHREEKEALEAEKKALEDQAAQLDPQIKEVGEQLAATVPTGNVPSEEEALKMQEQIKALEERRSGLGLFAGKEKKAIAEEIASLNGKIDALQDKIEAEKQARQSEADEKAAPFKAKLKELKAELDKINRRISEIEKEFTKDRP